MNELSQKNRVCFRNPGILAPEMFEVFGVSVKLSDNPIGSFGTGLKFAIAIILRLGGKIFFCSNNNRYEFSTRKAVIRGKEFDLVTVNGKDLNFTTELGGHWEPWMAYRELHSNTLDEGGSIFLLSGEQEVGCRENETIIVVDCKEIFRVYETRSDIYLETKPLFSYANCEIHLGESKYVFYKGVRIHEIPFKYSKYTYNITDYLDISEDRVAKYSWQIDEIISRCICNLQDETLIRNIIAANSESLEHSLSGYHKPSDEFIRYGLDQYTKNPSAVSQNFSRILFSNKNTLDIWVPITLKNIDHKRLERAKFFVSEIGFPTDEYKIIVVETLGPTALALANRELNTIVISKRVFDMGLKQLCSTLIEEVIHLREGLDDRTTSMQTYLFDRIVSMGEEIIGEVL